MRVKNKEDYKKKQLRRIIGRERPDRWLWGKQPKSPALIWSMMKFGVYPPPRPSKRKEIEENWKNKCSEIDHE